MLSTGTWQDMIYFKPPTVILVRSWESINEGMKSEKERKGARKVMDPVGITEANKGPPWEK